MPEPSMPEPSMPEPSAPRLRTPSLHARVTLTILALLTALLLVLGLTLDAVLSSRLQAQLRERLIDRASFASVIADQVSSPQQLADRLEGDGVSVRLVTTDGTVVTAGRQPGTGQASSASDPPTASAAPGPPGPAGGAPDPGPGRPTARDVVDGGSYLSISERLEDGTVLELYAARASVDEARAQVRFALVVAAGIVLLLAALSLVPVVRTALRPLTRITRVARGVSEGNRGRRLRPDRPSTELGRLGMAFDAMLDDVEGAELQARASEQRLREFVSDAAHELRTPLTGIRATSEHLLRVDPGRDERERLLVTLVRESARAGRLVEDLLLMARIDRGLELRHGAVSIAALVAHCLAPRRAEWPEVELTVEVPDGLEVHGDEERLTQVVGNLLDNAVQAAGPTGHVVVGASVHDDEVWLDVSDDGPGVAPADRERIFERLTRLDAARERRSGGVGLGLPIALGIARAHGGDLGYRDRPGTPGACFRLRLPLEQQVVEPD